MYGTCHKKISTLLRPSHSGMVVLPDVTQALDKTSIQIVGTSAIGWCDKIIKSLNHNLSLALSLALSLCIFYI